MDGYVERNGTFWIEGLPLAAGTNTLTLAATDAAANTVSTDLTIIQCAGALTINPIPEDQLHRLKTTVSGTVTNASYTVSVNGVAAVVDGSGTWTADGVPINAGGTACFQAEATPPGGGAPIYASRFQDKPARVWVERYDLAYLHHLRESGSSISPVLTAEYAIASWQERQGASSNYMAAYAFCQDRFWLTNHAQWPPDAYPPVLSGTNWSFTGTPSLVDPLALPIEQCDIAGVVTSDSWEQGRYARSAHATVKLFTGGKDVPGQQSLFSLSETLMERKWAWNFGGGQTVDLAAIDPSKVMLGAYGPLDSSNLVYAAFADGKEVDITASSTFSVE